MRPRHYTAENEAYPRRLEYEQVASMRPRHYTAENSASGRRFSRGCAGFNEAAALHRGKRGAADAVALPARRASMRPRHYTAENHHVVKMVKT